MRNSRVSGIIFKEDIPMSLLDVKPYDLAFYNEHLKDFLPDTFIDCHTHIWLDKDNHFTEDTANRS